MAIYYCKPSFTFGAEEGCPYRWCDKRAFMDELLARGLTDSQVDKVWRMYADKAFILKHRISDRFEYVIDRQHMTGMALELGIHGRRVGVTAADVLADLVRRAGCFMMWMSHDGSDEADDRVVQFASPMYQTGVIT